MKIRRETLAVAIPIAVMLLIASFCLWGIIPRYPYGRSHSCDLILMGALEQYAVDHEGNFPSGEPTAEASLSLLYPKYLNSAETLRGKSIPVEVVDQRLSSGQRLTPETCGWHYVPGLTTKDDSRIAIFWDKAGLGHNGMWLYGDRIVMRLSSSRERISANRWDDFLAEQSRLLAERKSLKP